MDGMKVMDDAMATVMEDLLATLRRWTGNGDECHDGNSRQWMAYWQRNGNEWIVGGATVMEGLRTAQQQCNGNGAMRQDEWHNGDGNFDGQWQWMACPMVMEGLRMARRQRNGDGATQWWSIARW
jgi:hypothetical protein